MPLRDWACCVGGAQLVEDVGLGTGSGPKGTHEQRVAITAAAPAAVTKCSPNAVAGRFEAKGGVATEEAVPSAGSRGWGGSATATIGERPAGGAAAGCITSSARATVDSPSEMNDGADPPGGSSGSWPSRRSGGRRAVVAPSARLPTVASPFATISAQLPAVRANSNSAGLQLPLGPGAGGVGGNDEPSEPAPRPPLRWMVQQDGSGPTLVPGAAQTATESYCVPNGGSEAGSVFALMSVQAPAVSAAAEGEGGNTVGAPAHPMASRAILQPLGSDSRIESAPGANRRRPALRHTTSASALIPGGASRASSALMRRLVSRGSGAATPLGSQSSTGGHGQLLTLRGNSRGAGTAATGAASLMSACSSTSASLFAAAHTRAWSAPPPTPPPIASDSAGSGGGASGERSSQLAERAATRTGSWAFVAGAGDTTAGPPTPSHLPTTLRTHSRRMPWQSRKQAVLAGTSNRAGPLQTPATTPALPDASPAAVAARFAAAFVAALETGDTRWASAPHVATLFDTDVRLVGLDHSLHIGKMAVLRRLNGAMEQFVKLVGAHNGSEGAVDDSGGGASSSRGSPDGGAVELQTGDNPAQQEGADSVGGTAGSGAAAGTSGAAAPASALSSPAGSVAYAAAVKRMACSVPPSVEVTIPDPNRRPGTVSVRYAFRFGIRRFAMRDAVVVKRGAIVRLRRSRD